MKQCIASIPAIYPHDARLSGVEYRLRNNACVVCYGRASLTGYYSLPVFPEMFTRK